VELHTQLEGEPEATGPAYLYTIRLHIV